MHILFVGIMQLAMLAPYNNLATSVAAALVPTLLAPKIRITDENQRSQSLAAPGSDQASTTASAAPMGTDFVTKFSPVFLNMFRISERGRGERKTGQQLDGYGGCREQRLAQGGACRGGGSATTVLARPQAGRLYPAHGTAAHSPRLALRRRQQCGQKQENSSLAGINTKIIFQKKLCRIKKKWYAP